MTVAADAATRAFILIVLIFLGGLTAIVLRAGLNNSGQAARRPSSSRPSLSARESKPASSISVDRPRTSPAPRASKAYTQYRTEGLAVHSVTEGLGAYWVGTTGGVIRYRKDTKVATIFDNTSGLWSNLVRHVRIDPALGVVVGTFGGGLSLFDPAHQTWRHLSIADGLPDTFVQWTLRSRAGDLWIATWSGVCLVRNGVVDDLRSWTCYDVVSTAGGLPSDRIYALAEDDSGSIWAATDSGIARFRSGVWRGWTHADGLGAEISAKALAAETTPGRKRDIGATALGRNRHPEADSTCSAFRSIGPSSIPMSSRRFSLMARIVSGREPGEAAWPCIKTDSGGTIRLPTDLPQTMSMELPVIATVGFWWRRVAVFPFTGAGIFNP